MSADQSSESISATTSRNVTIYVNVMYITRGIKDVTHILENYNMRYIWTERHFLSNKIHIFFGNFFFSATKRAASEMAMCCALSLVVVSTCLADAVFPENSRAFPRSDRIMHRVNTPRS